MANNSHKYYLAVEEQIIRFDLCKGLPDMTSFLNLSLFTGLFTGGEELLSALSSLGLVTHDFFSPFISIVKRRRNPKSGYDYVFVTSDILYKKNVRFMGAKCIEKFFFDNRYAYPALSRLLKQYLSDTEGLITIFEEKVAILQEKVNISPSKDRRSIKDELAKRQNSLHNFYLYRRNIEAILEIIALISSESYHFDNELEMEYISRLSNFVRGEVNYVRPEKTTPNYRGLVSLTNAIGKLLDEYPSLVSPMTSQRFAAERAMLLKTLKRELEGNKDIEKIDEDDFDSGEGSDPDHFMYLEDDDYDRMLVGTSSKLRDNIQEDKQNLLERKEKLKKL